MDASLLSFTKCIRVVEKIGVQNKFEKYELVIWFFLLIIVKIDYNWFKLNQIKCTYIALYNSHTDNLSALQEAKT